MIRLGMVADIHCGPDTEALLGSRAPQLLDAFAEAMRQFRPHAIIDLGDRVNDVAAGQDRQWTAWVRQQLLGSGVPVFHVLGNHDVVNLTKAELGTILNKRGAYESAEVEGVRLVMLDSQDAQGDGIGGGIGAEQQRWLTATLAASPLPTLVFCHHPLDEQRLDDHWYFAEHREQALVRERVPVRSILERAGVLAVFSGHLHWTRAASLNGIPYATLGSLVGADSTPGRPCGAFAAVTVDGTTIDIEVAGLLPARFRLTAAARAP